MSDFCQTTYPPCPILSDFAWTPQPPPKSDSIYVRSLKQFSFPHSMSILFYFAGVELLSQRHESRHLCTFEPKSLQWASGLQIGIWWLLESLRWFSVTRFDYNGAKKSHDLSKIQGLWLVEILIVKKKSFTRFALQSECCYFNKWEVLNYNRACDF